MFSIVIPLYNKELSVKNTIQSVLNQTFQNFEIVIVNDGSTDTSAAIVEDMSDSRIRLIHQKNQGVSAARNMGIAESHNKWIAFLDADDLWEINHLEEVNRMFHKFPNEKVYTTSFYFSDHRDVFKHTRQSEIFKVENYFKEALKEYLMWTSIVVIDKECVDEVGGFNIDLNHGEDLEFWARLARKYLVVKSSVITACYRIEAENRTKLTSKVKKTHAYYFDLSLALTVDEKKYYNDIILDILYAYLRMMDFYSVLELKKKHPDISWSDFSSFVLIYIKKRIKEKL